jgi:hypothetical protein
MHWTLVQRILHYLKEMSEMGIACPQKQILQSQNQTGLLDAYVDADHAGDHATRKSTTGFVIRLCGSPVAWCSRLQKCIAEHTCEAEFIALNEAAHDILFLAHLTNETLGLNVFPATLYEDNFAALQQSQNSVRKGKLKHVEIRYLKIREYINENT